MIDEKVGGRALVLDVIREDLWVGRFEPNRKRVQSLAKVCERDGETYMILSFGSADVTAEMTSVRQLRTFSVIPSLSIMIIYITQRPSQYSTAKDEGRHTYAPASRNVFARSMSHLGSRVPADSSSSTDASPPAPHLQQTKVKTSAGMESR